MYVFARSASVPGMAIAVSVLKTMHWRDEQEFNEPDVVRWKEASKRAFPLQGILLKYEVGVPIMFSLIHAIKYKMSPL